MSAKAKTKAKPASSTADVRTMGASADGDIVALLDATEIAGYVLAAGVLARISWQADEQTFASYCIAQPDHWSAPRTFPAATRVRLVSTVADRLAGRTIDTEIVKDAVGSGVPIEASGGLPGMGDV